MKKRIMAFLTGVSIMAAMFAGCGKKTDDKTIRIGAAPTPHAEILKVIEDDLKEKGFKLEIVEYNDYVLPNKALEAGELDANYFQHRPYLEDFNEKNKTHGIAAAGVHFEPFGIYAGRTDDLSKLKEGAVVAVPNDTTNEGRALLLLEAEGLIKLREGAGITATVMDIVENPLKLEIKELEAAQAARVMKDVDIACVNGNYAIKAGYSIKDALAVEKADSLAAETYTNIVAVKEGNEDSPKTKALAEAILSDEVRNFINEQYEGAVVPVF